MNLLRVRFIARSSATFLAFPVSRFTSALSGCAAVATRMHCRLRLLSSTFWRSILRLRSQRVLDCHLCCDRDGDRVPAYREKSELLNHWLDFISRNSSNEHSTPPAKSLQLPKPAGTSYPYHISLPFFKGVSAVDQEITLHIDLPVTRSEDIGTTSNR